MEESKNPSMVGGRNYAVHKYAHGLAAKGMSFSAIRKSVLQYNSKLKSPLQEEEVFNTILTPLKKSFKGNN